MSHDNFLILSFAEARQPEYRERKGQGYIEFGEKNDYPNYLLDLFNKSAKHNAIIRGKVNYITGNGWKGGEGFVAQHQLNEVTKKVATDIEIFGGAYIEVIWSMVQQISYVGHIDYTKIRTNKDNTQFFYKEDWKDRKATMKTLSAFNPKNPVGSQIIYLKEYRPGLDSYALPGYLGALNYIESDIEVSKHVLGNAQTGFSASKMITLTNGEPSDDEKRNIERRFTDRFSGSDGKKFILSFVTNADRKPIVDDLGASDLTKEDFGMVDSLIQQNIFAGHQLTSPSLFGIAEPGKLGSRTEMRDAYEIFKNTYVNDKQRFLEQTFSLLAGEELKIVPVEPVSFELSEAALLQIAPKEWLLEKAGIDISTVMPVDPATGRPVQEAMVNENVKNLTGRQHQQLLRIIRQFGQGKITREIAVTLLKTSLGLSDDEITTMLNIDEEQNFSEADEVEIFKEYGEERGKFTIHQSRPFRFKEEAIDNTIDKKILSILNKQPLTPPEDIAKALRISVDEANARLGKLIDAKVITIDKSGARKLTEPLKKLVDTPTTTSFEIRYSYEWKPSVPSGERDSVDHPSRPFCARLMELDRFWTRTEIETISRRLGYSVFDRGGGWWGKSPSCRHQWVSNIVVKKPKQ